jgi:hypothetical protein
MMKMQEQPALCDLPIAGRQAQFVSAGARRRRQ